MHLATPMKPWPKHSLNMRGSVDEALTDASLLKRVAKNAEQAVQKRYEQKNCHCRHKVAMTGSLMSLWSAFSS